ncbi:GNAT family N-acetyltransferase [Sphingomonas sp. SUN039]|uniref:GNAT family N-acetyltransferase n=1 Tax=Sphingomonas sp. SUN039 TaxID=2937787 RepID=UPI002164EA68|nr:GNAT family N-acetyltransferase [Sphingomonas sp. SUN039]UVO55769.1 GNAT family N-acetyltransferase [Sphingomonas sp. SUN039]
MPFTLDAAAALGLSFRAVTDADMPFLSALYASTRADELSVTGWPEATKALFVVQQFAAQHGDYARNYPGMERRIVEQRGAAVGRVYVDLTGDACHLIDIALMPTARGQGMGRAILTDLLAYAARVEKPVKLSVIADNPARRLYERLGFVTTETGTLYNSMTWQPPKR